MRQTGLIDVAGGDLFFHDVHSPGVRGRGDVGARSGRRHGLLFTIGLRPLRERCLDALHRGLSALLCGLWFISEAEADRTAMLRFVIEGQQRIDEQKHRVG